MSGRGAERILQILEWMASETEPVSFVQVVAAFGFPKSSTLDLLRILVTGEYAEKTPDGRYRLLRVPGEPGRPGHGYGTLLRHADPCMRQAVEITRESGFVAVLTEDRDISYILKILPDREIRYDRDVTVARRPHQVSSGIILLGSLTQDELRDYVTTERTSGRFDGSFEDLAAQVEAARTAGFQITAVGIVEGAGGMAAPIRGRDGKISAAINIAGPAHRIADEVDTIEPVLRETAAAISRAMGAGTNTKQPLGKASEGKPLTT